MQTTLLSLSFQEISEEDRMIIDFHPQAFPDTVAAKAIPALAKEGNVKAHTEGIQEHLNRILGQNGERLLQ